VDERELATPDDIEAAIKKNRWFWLLFLKAGPNRDQDEATLDRLQLAHLQHLNWLRRQGLLTLFGPVEDAGDLRGIGVLLVTTREEAEALMADDPMVRAGRLIAEIRPWFTQPGASLPDGRPEPT
jgi:uncharacterized protein YciI